MSIGNGLTMYLGQQDTVTECSVLECVLAKKSSKDMLLTEARGPGENTQH